jgi:hypothetical protein
MDESAWWPCLRGQLDVAILDSLQRFVQSFPEKCLVPLHGLDLLSMHIFQTFHHFFVVSFAVQSTPAQFLELVGQLPLLFLICATYLGGPVYHTGKMSLESLDLISLGLINLLMLQLSLQECQVFAPPLSFAMLLALSLLQSHMQTIPTNYQN